MSDNDFVIENDVLIEYIGHESKVTIPDGVKHIGNGVFGGCLALKSISLPDGLLSIGEGAFAECIKLKSITIPDGVSSIGCEAFDGCSSLTSISFPSSLKEFDTGILTDCTRLQSITVPESHEIYRTFDGNLYSKDGKTLYMYAPGKRMPSLQFQTTLSVLTNRHFQTAAI